MLGLLMGALNVFGKLGGKLIEDKDKKTEFAFKTLEIGQQFMKVMLETKTYPWVDALVKLSYAGEQIIKGLFRPLGAMAAMVFIGYSEVNGIELSPVVEVIMASLLPAWGVSRYKEKQVKGKQKQQVLDDLDEEW